MGFDVKHPTARKEHACQFCRRTIDRGERYLRGSGWEDGTAWSWKECAHCEAVRRLYDITADGTYDEMMFDSWADEARDVAELRHAAGYRMQWRTRRGTLLPVPEFGGFGSEGDR